MTHSTHSQPDSTPASRLRWLLWPQLGLVVYATVAAYLGWLPGGLLAWPYSDKVLHFALFGLPAAWLDLWLRGRDLRITDRLRVPVAFAAVLSVAGIEELLQLLSANRSADVTDLLCDIAGVAVLIAARRRFIAAGPAPRRASRPASRAA